MATSSRRAAGAEGFQRPQYSRHQHQHQHQTLNQHQRRAHTQQTAAANDAKHAQIIATQSKTRPSQNILQQSNSTRMKRPLDNIDHIHDPLKTKRARITVEILARPVSQALSPPRSITVKPQVPANLPNNYQNQQQQQPTVAPVQKPPPPAQSPSTAAGPAPAPPQDSTTATTTDHGLTKHQEKVISGIRHELDRLQPNAADTSSAQERPGRKLRSQEATRFKSELAAYFPDYDEVIGNDPKEQHILNSDTPIIVVDTDRPQSTRPPTADAELHDLSHQPNSPIVRAYADNLFSGLHDSQRIDFAFLEAGYNGNHVVDPLPDAYYAPSHRKAERLEKSIRNTERGRAQHEKDQIIRLLNELQGHDWLRTMGVNGVTESRKKTFEPARDHFIRGCQAILEKFRLWSQEEKKRKLEKERALAEEAEEDDEGKDEEEEISDDADEEVDEDVEMVDAGEEESASENANESEPVDYSDVDASAKQLHDEAMARAKYAASSSSKRSRGEPPPRSPEPMVLREFTSFFDKKHQRDAALSKGRRRGRTILAWGHPIPETMEQDFELPEEYRDEETMKAHERQKRRERRQHKQ
ncbi:Uu.00g031080.m01.CDS01 [Anthostomella pinea]|uniref:Uu.00g031080.m01.CDS01 n=1 Tax=Anthostomella pinea TaxID=933095 RepID=A0AAI8V8G0_9PEZI|nr:Uu.00g031080.m01.CDS01 [Anthostomella pinea]